jgi:uncharacterized membrane protein
MKARVHREDWSVFEIFARLKRKRCRYQKLISPVLFLFVKRNKGKSMLDHWVQGRFKALSDTFWFIPAIVSLSGPLLALIFLVFDYAGISANGPFLFSGGVSSASALLSTIAGSLITVEGLAFSITIVVLQLVSSQYTPRALRGFLQDRITQFVAGGFFAIFSYALIVLATVLEPAPPAQGFVPRLSVTIGIVLSFLGLALLLLFIHHTGRIIQVSDIAARTAEQTLQAIDQQYTNKGDEIPMLEITAQVQSLSMDEKPASIVAPRSGYVQRIELAHLLTDIMRPHLHLRFVVAPGDFVTDGSLIAELWPSEAASERVRRAIHHHVHIERERDITYDAKFGVRQLTDIALRALSPAVNDPTTAVLCIKYLQAIFEHLARQALEVTAYHFAQGTSSIALRRPAFHEYIRMYVEISLYAGGNSRVINTLLRALTSVAQITASLNSIERADVLQAVSAKILAHAFEQISNEQDRAHIREQVDQIEQILREKKQDLNQVL